MAAHRWQRRFLYMFIEKKDIKSYTPEELREEFKKLEIKPYRADQIIDWLYKGVTSFDEMLNLPKDLRKNLDEQYYINKLSLLKKQVSKEDGTVKYLWELVDKNSLETVLMKYHHGYTVCVSTQVGCRQGCVFCASCLNGFTRNLLPSEIIDQILFVQKESGIKISNIVLMGIGEPLDNYDNVLKFIRLANHHKCLNIGLRHITLSTCGLADKVDKLAQNNLQLMISISLHATTEEIRSAIMPVNKRFSLEELLNACERYTEISGKRLSFEYAMIKGVNDSKDDAHRLAEISKRLGAHVNLIPLNHVAERKLEASEQTSINNFYSLLKEKGAIVTIRRRLGSDIDASCGQLRKKISAKSNE